MAGGRERSNRPRGPDRPVIPFRDESFSFSETPPTEPKVRYLLKHHWANRAILLGVSFLSFALVSAAVLSIHRSRSARETSETLREKSFETTKAKAATRSTTHGEPSQPVRDRHQLPNDNLASLPHLPAGKGPAIPETSPNEATLWLPQSADEAALWNKLSSRAKQQIEKILAPTANKSSARLQAVGILSRESLAALAAWGREEEVTLALGPVPDIPPGTEKGKKAQGEPVPDAKTQESPSQSQLAEQASSIGAATAQTAARKVPVEALLGLLVDEQDANANLESWQATLENPGAATILQAAALKRLGETSTPESTKILSELPSRLSVSREPAATPTEMVSESFLWANLYAQLVRRDTVETRFALATELLTAPSAERRGQLLEAVAAYGSVNHRGILVLAHADPEERIRTRATEILHEKQQ